MEQYSNKEHNPHAPYTGTTDRLTTEQNGNAKGPVKGPTRPLIEDTPAEEARYTIVAGPPQHERGVARLDAAAITRLGCQIGDIVLITGKRTTAARLLPGQQRDSIVLHRGIILNSASKPGEQVTVRKANNVADADEISLLPLNAQGTPLKPDSPLLLRFLTGLPVTIGDVLSVPFSGSTPTDFLVIGTTPSTPIYKVSANESERQPEQETGTDAVIIQANTAIRIQTRDTITLDTTAVGYKDIGGLDKELQRIREMVELPLKFPAVFDRVGIEPPKGVLLYGPPGTGKTMIARAMANETNSAFYVINGPEVINKFYGESEQKLRNIFQEAQQNAPSIIFIDELDALAPKRPETGGEVERRIVGQLLALMDGLTSRGQVVLIGATNQPNALDPAIRRPGRFDREIPLRVPDIRGRIEVLKIHSRNAALAPDVDFNRLAQMTPGFVGADLAALCREAAMVALRRNLPRINELLQGGFIPYETLVNLQITMNDFQTALREIEPSTIREVYVEVSETSWDDVGGLQKVKDMLTESVEWPLLYPDLYEKARVTPPRGILLAGPPGSGKTLLARALANQCDASFISIKGPELLSKWVGESERGIREIFRRAKHAAPCIIFFDEIDALAMRRSSDTGADGSVGARIIAQLLTEMDGIEGREGIIVLAATNRPELIDPALLRPGRFDLVVELDYPNEEERRAIFEVHMRERPIAPDVTAEDLARRTEGRSGADIEAICRRAALLALREQTSLKQGKALPKPEVVASEVQQAVETTEQAQEEAQPPTTAELTSMFLIRAEHFELAIQEQTERYEAQQKKEEKQQKLERGRERLLEMAADRDNPQAPDLSTAAPLLMLVKDARFWMGIAIAVLVILLILQMFFLRG
ncbi:transitional endoplasmic reticulum ATPase [Thermosporothrix hazakensis]|jgi:transitional endoplasmic reticulum ATPase|uniref:Transitional endoplasmic reticulum ATPase n=2 Tax=Thermosporothrix TaxID=768650 RepID=A0A326UCK9_THEHA|nr:CDC48 family AAA ATPase [Thermosporothrix hazakensis]PZW36227.1 transitional endoplasmic reticulum ATPase [Thermosporothrix hazakensis]BBH88690.1 ATPase AAA [Thermosporothrix sp. COM3]GCE46876.1 ATPase AAA [Thermosporothrix hazakensis]